VETGDTVVTGAMEPGGIADGAGAEAGDIGPGAGATGTMAGDTLAILAILAILAMAAGAMAATIVGRSFSSALPGTLGFDDLRCATHVFACRVHRDPRAF